MQRYFSNKKNNNKFILSNDDLYHIRTVMRMVDGSKIEVVFEQEVYVCELKNVNSEIDIIIVEKLDNFCDTNKEIILAIPLVKEQKMDLILQKSTELGVNKIIPFVAERSVVKLKNEKEKCKVERWQKICKEASEQSKRIDIPIVTSVKKISDLIEYDGLKVVCSTKKNVNSIKMFLQNHNEYDKLLLVIGPEGGLSTKEENYLVDNNFVPVTLGNRIMRVETVPLFVLSVINYEMME